MGSLNENGSKRVALYARVSSEDQAENETIDIQVDFLRRYADLNALEIVGEYLDDGVSGTIPFSRRPAGARLFEHAREGRFDAVLFYRVNRLGRRLGVVLNAHEELDAAGVVLRSGTEPIDTSSPIGRFVFQLLGSFAELDRETILDNTADGKLKGAKNGRWYGTCPLGYTVRDGRLAICTDEIMPGVRECDLARDIIERLAAGSSVRKEADRLTALGIVPFVRHATHDGRVTIKTEFTRRGRTRRPSEWSVQRVSRLIRGTIYKGTHTFTSKRRGSTTVAVPALVDEATWRRANEQLHANRWRERMTARSRFPLSGLVRCGICGGSYSGHRIDRRSRLSRYYRCARYTTEVADGSVLRTRCPGRNVDADWLEGAIWADIDEFLSNPGPVVDELELSRYAIDGNADVERRRRLVGQIAELDTQRRTVLDMIQRRMIDMDEGEQRTTELVKLRAALQAELDLLANQRALAEAYAAQAADVRAMLEEQRAWLNSPATQDHEARQERRERLMRGLVRRIVVETVIEGSTKRATARPFYAFTQPSQRAASAVPVQRSR